MPEPHRHGRQRRSGRIRDGKEIEQIKKDFLEEDSFIFDVIQFSKTRRERLAKWQDKSQH
ncbi:hypothetical protein [Rhizobium leguminosarum]|uniref:hypothetical protein n=1 Tax=Rhizobium leguminosarum TaxID=384 RepID=UPI000FEC8BDA|nr:hypothetical protein [Rhizobium leguminosarum]RWX23976.1 hypothetical protein EHI43_32900 [Rhizobium leguminosarum]